MSKLEKLPTWSEVNTKDANGEVLTLLERFICEHEPPRNERPFRELLLNAINDEIRKAIDALIPFSSAPAPSSNFMPNCLMTHKDVERLMKFHHVKSYRLETVAPNSYTLFVPLDANLDDIQWIIFNRVFPAYVGLEQNGAS